MKLATVQQNAVAVAVAITGVADGVAFEPVSGLSAREPQATTEMMSTRPTERARTR
jgi:hypothetical protein